MGLQLSSGGEMLVSAVAPVKMNLRKSPRRILRVDENPLPQETGMSRGNVSAKALRERAASASSSSFGNGGSQGDSAKRNRR